MRGRAEDDASTQGLGARPDEKEVAARAWRATPRFSMVRILGAGGMGVVFEAYDHERGARVALKTLREASPEALLRFKEEFHSHANVHHENLVRLGELIETDAQWFFTMELVDGQHFLAWVGAPPLGPAAEHRLRDGLVQLTGALQALHREQRVHRDIKSSNVLVSNEGRLVVVDFGVVADISRGSSSGRAVLGTPSYMAPEQAAGAPASAAADWYAVGVLLYQALCGEGPFAGPPDEVARQKAERDPVRPGARADGVPADLDELCMRLLSRDVAARADGDAILRALGDPAPAAGAPEPTVFVGRRRELDALHAAFGRSRDGAATTVHIRGESGIGKSELARHFTDELDDRAAAGPTIVLVGRCYEHESVPYKAVDGIVDALARRLVDMDACDLAALLAADVALLAQTFPVLNTVAAIAALGRPLSVGGDPRALRADMFAAFRELVRRLARRFAVVLLVDDAQWADADGVDLLAELVRPPGAPALLLVLVSRGAGEEAAPIAALGRRAEVQALELAPLPAADADALIQELGRFAGAPADAAVRERLGRDAGGHPLFIHELVRRRAPGGDEGAATSLEEVLWQRIVALDGPARELLTLLAVSGRPVGGAVLQNALAVDREELVRRSARLLGGRLARRLSDRAADRVDVYHDRIRHAVLAHLGDGERGGLHERLARAHEAVEPEEAEALATHWQAAGDTGRAAEYAIRASRRAASVLAFDRAARFAEAALALLPADAPVAAELRVELGDALAYGGHGPFAARAYLDAARGRPPRQALELQRRAVEQYLRCGHVDEGLEAARSVLRGVGIDLPRTSRRAMLSALWLRARVRLRGLGFRERDAEGVPKGDLARVDVCWSMAIGLGIVDNVRGAAFQSRHLLLALRAGEPRRVARALALEAAYAGIYGRAGRRRARRIADRALALAERLGDPHTLGLALGSAGAAACLAGDWREARDLLERAAPILHGCAGADWELVSARMFALIACNYLGELDELARVAGYLREAQARGDLYAASTLLGRIGWMVALHADDPAEARRQTAEALRDWSSLGYHTQHRYHLYAASSIDLYTGDAAAAHDRLGAGWRALRSSLFLRVQIARIEMLDVRARAALAVAAQAGPGRARAALLQSVRSDSERLESERTPWATALARLLRAGAAATAGERDAALGLLAAAEEAAARAGMLGYRAVANRRYGELTGGAAGAALVAAADGWLRGRSVARPERYAAMLAPGFE